MAEEEHLLGSASCVLARCPQEDGHMVGVWMWLCVSLGPHLGSVPAGACRGPLHPRGRRGGRHLPGESVGVCQYPKPA